jgi:lipopolysaccharide/colanic/teichoic acid biosynthesis glycosyltransferase
MSTQHSQIADSGSAFRADVSLQRAFDFCCALLAMVLLAPVMLIIGVAIWMGSGRPIFFSQLRLGQRGRPFYMYKFRKFGAACGNDGTPLTRHDDNRFTAIGRILALTKADELPQFFNILKGNMSIVGPRPESLTFADCFSNGYERLLDYKPGLFGPAQVLFRHEQRFYPTNADLIEFYKHVLFPVKARIDLDYFTHRSFFGDLGWIIRGVLAVVGLTSSIQPELSKIGFSQDIMPQKRDGAGP